MTLDADDGEFGKKKKKKKDKTADEGEDLDAEFGTKKKKRLEKEDGGAGGRRRGRRGRW